jgi:putative hydrolase of HD superfamily
MYMTNSIFYVKALLNLARTGWLLRGVPASIAETVAEHSFLSAYICIELGSRIQGVDIGKAVLYSLTHDLGEAFVGDITKPVGLRLGELKSRIEEDYVVNNIDNELIKELYRRYASQSDFEAKLAKICNYISTLLTGVDYEKLGYKVNEIVRNAHNEVLKLSKELNIRELVEKLLSELVTDTQSTTFKNS